MRSGRSWSHGAATALAALGVLLTTAPSAAAQDDGARTYWPAPVNTHVLSTFIFFAAGNTSAFNPTLPFENVAFDARVFTLNYDAFVGLFGRANHLHVTLPAGTLEGTTVGLNPVNIDVAAKGRADPVAFWVVNLFGAPAMGPSEFASYRQGTLLNAVLYVTAPFGSYDEDRLLNLGTDRWMFRFGPSFTQSFGEWAPGRRTTLELVPSVALFTTAENSATGVSVEQAPVFRLESHVTRDVAPGAFLSGDLLWMAGGETTLDGVAQDNSQSSLSLGLTAGFQVSDAFSMKATWMNALTDAVDGVNLNIARFQFFYAWNPIAQRMQREAPAGR